MKITVRFGKDPKKPCETTKEIEAEVFGLLAVHENRNSKGEKPTDEEPWVVTHVPTGGTIAYLPDADAARAFVKLASRATIPDEPDPSRASEYFRRSWIPFREACVALAKGVEDAAARADAVKTIKAFIAEQNA